MVLPQSEKMRLAAAGVDPVRGIEARSSGELARVCWPDGGWQLVNTDAVLGVLHLVCRTASRYSR